MRGAAATDGSVPVGRRPVQQSRGDLTPNLVLLGNSAQTWDTRTHVSSGFRAQLNEHIDVHCQHTFGVLVEDCVIVLNGAGGEPRHRWRR